MALSDPVSDWDTPLREQWAEDLAAVIVAAACDRPTVFSWDPHGVARTGAIRYPELIGRLVLWNPAAQVVADDSGWVAEFIESGRRMRAGDDTGRQQSTQSRWTDPAYREWVDSAGRAGASPSQADRLSEKTLTDQPVDDSEVTTPTLVITHGCTAAVLRPTAGAPVRWMIRRGGGGAVIREPR